MAILPGLLKSQSKNQDKEPEITHKSTQSKVFRTLHLREGRIPQDWQDKPAKLSHKDRHARWTLKFTKAKRQEDGTLPATDLAIPFFGYKSHVSIDRKFRLIRKWKTTDAAASDGARLREGLLDKTNTASTVWADTAYRSKANEDFMEKEGFVSKVHRKKPHLKPMPRHIQRSNAGKSVIRSRVDAEISQKGCTSG
ncbi:hypothetical protein S1001342_00851 [Acetobacter pasteurianus subsp. pasteurianus]|uniref:Transposase IS4-like domain-containing protein n=1 Tax=Acetobacter pasteurianus subsp. pasteurianus TaxID=481145 RepID=A0A1Y0Y4R7_ACEPA|nr:hypothetical protein S1001342_00851 [Acetobacter pasteurianus subsp. pasteurianus]